MAIFPGMEELSAMMYVNQYRQAGEFGVIVLDCAPTAEFTSLCEPANDARLVHEHIFGFQRNIVTA
jgi:arsenite/tail-anchored protein-transporting ATPase